MTAEEKYNEFDSNIIKWMQDHNCITTKDITTKLMIEFAQFHVKAALEVASEQAVIDTPDWDKYELNKESILDAYPLENIK